MSSYLSGQIGGSNPNVQRIRLLQDDIRKQDTDVIAVSVPQSMQNLSEVEQDLVAASGTSLNEYLHDEIRRPQVGKVYVADRHSLPCKNIFYYIRRDRKDDFDRRESDLTDAIRTTFEELNARRLTTASFPPLDIGRKGFPLERAARLMLQAMSVAIGQSITEVRIVCAEADAYNAFHKRLRALGWTGR